MKSTPLIGNLEFRIPLFFQAETPKRKGQNAPEQPKGCPRVQALKLDFGALTYSLIKLLKYKSLHASLSIFPAHDQQKAPKEKWNKGGIQFLFFN